MKHLLHGATLALASVVAIPASAVPITYTLGTDGASGMLGGNPFITSDLTFVLNADTDDIAPTGFGDLAVKASSATVIFNGSTFDILSPIGLYAGSGGFGMWRPDDGNLLEFEGSEGIDLSLATSATALTYKYTQWSGRGLDDVDTSAGVLVFDDQSDVSGSFGAVLAPVTLVPLPAASWMLIAALGALVGRSKLARHASFAR
ncbi:hypothetical protein [uncultured Roseobacter sp.]|uniref:hypothetical protein n=1 Tax=uncultured Roseobacter sp. TaxID=114847 RepID=UPI00260FAB8A|nr:hypothetical protein [uncultured Roseobacter sp.]